MKQSRLLLLLPLFFLFSCSGNSDITERFNTIEKRFALFLNFEGCKKNITDINSDTASRSSYLQIIATILPQAFNYLNAEIEYINSITVTDDNKSLIDNYKSKIGTLFSEHVKIFRLWSVESMNRNKSADWGTFYLEGDNADVLRQRCKNMAQVKSSAEVVGNLNLMRFKKHIIEYPDNHTDVSEVQSPADSELIPMKM